MRYSEIINEQSLSPDELLQKVRLLSNAKCSVDKDDQKKKQVWISFEFQGTKGFLLLEAKNPQKYNSYLWAAARSELGGREPTNWTTALNTIKGNIRANAIKILTNPENWQVTNHKYDPTPLLPKTPASPISADTEQLDLFKH